MGAMPPQPSGSGSSRTRLWWIIGSVIAVMVVAIVVLATVPVQETTSFNWGASSGGSVSIYFNDSWPQRLCPAGAKASVSFSSHGLNVTFGIVDPNGTTLWSRDSPQTSTTFTVPSCGFYQFTAAGSGEGSYTIDGTLSYTAPLL